jgi:hypothetical protein
MGEATTTGRRAAVVGAPGRARPSAAAALLLLTALLAGCASILRQDPPPPEATAALPILGLPNARFWPDGPPEALAREARLAAEREAEAALGTGDGARGPRRRLPPADFLAVSGGGDNGAFGAGLLVGWTATGERPSFNVVTGISAGALIAPFAFLGPGYDDRLREVFTAVAPGDVLRVGSLLQTAVSAVFGEAIADTSPLYRLIQRHADARMLAAIAREYARGRLLLIGTTNLDLQRPVIWNIGAIAASGHPDALKLFHRILLASASIPGAFPPVLVDVELDGRAFQEMHVDGGAATQVFFYPSRLDLPGVARARRQRTVWVIRNGRLQAEAASTARGVFSIASRSVSTLLHFSGVGDIGRIELLAARDGLRFRLAYIGADFRAGRREPFDTAYMQALFAYGEAKAREGRAWVDAPPVVGQLVPAAAGEGLPP